MGADEQSPDPVVVGQDVLPKGAHTFDYSIVIAGTGDATQAKAAAELAVQTLFDVGHHIEVATIVTRPLGLQSLRIAR